MPAGLSTRSIPSAWFDSAALLAVFGGIVHPRLASVDFGEKRFNPGGTLNGLVNLEDEIGSDAETNGARDAMTQMRRHAFQPFVCLLFFFVSSKHAHEYASVAEIRRNINSRHRDEADDPRVFGRFG
jgi:hypothetical protein